MGGHLLFCPVGTPNLVWISWKLKKFPRNIFCCSVLWADRSVPQRRHCRRACLTAPSPRPLLKNQNYRILSKFVGHPPMAITGQVQVWSVMTWSWSWTNDEQTIFINPTMHMSHITQYTIENKHVRIFVLNVICCGIWDTCSVEFVRLFNCHRTKPNVIV